MRLFGYARASDQPALDRQTGALRAEEEEYGKLDATDLLSHSKQMDDSWLFSIVGSHHHFKLLASPESLVFGKL